MKKLFLLAAIMMASTCVFAQHEPGSLTLQPRIGVSAADFNNTSDTEARVGLVVGPEFEYTLSNRFSLAFGVNYSQQGTKLKDNDVTFKMDYLTVPIVANVYLFKGFALKAGVQPGVNLSAKLDANGTKADIDDDMVKSFDVAIPFGLSYEFRNFVLDARYTLGLTKIFDEKKLNVKGVDLDSKNLGFQLTLGYKFTLF
ncbi:MAG: PorT family protein [Prevotella sp.]|nr:PorT family protein [Prevotella sp.]